MRILAIETACPPGSVALVDTNDIIAFHAMEAKQKTTAVFASVIQDVLRKSNWSPDSLDLVATCNGPGSFTGLRIGVTAAKVFAYSTKIDVIGRNTLEVIAAQCRFDGELTAVLDAQRGELFSATFGKQQSELTSIVATHIIHVDRWLQQLSPGVTVTGPGLSKIKHRIPNGVTIADESIWRPRADQLGLLAARQMSHKPTPELGRQQNMWNLLPKYFRKSAAEEKAEAVQKAEADEKTEAEHLE